MCSLLASVARRVLLVDHIPSVRSGSCIIAVSILVHRGSVDRCVDGVSPYSVRGACCTAMGAALVHSGLPLRAPFVGIPLYGPSSSGGGGVVGLGLIVVATPNTGADTPSIALDGDELDDAEGDVAVGTESYVLSCSFQSAGGSVVQQIRHAVHAAEVFCEETLRPGLQQVL